MLVGFNTNDRGIAGFIRTIEQAEDFIYSEECDRETEDLINYAIDAANNSILRAIRMRKAELGYEV